MCYEPLGMQATTEWGGLLQMTFEERKAQYFGDIFVRLPEPPYYPDHVDFWQTDRDENPKGIIRIVLEGQSQ